MKVLKVLAVCLLVVGCFFVSYWLRSDTSRQREFSVTDARVVAMAPSSGEVIYALGLEQQLVGVSRFATYPPEVIDLPKIGGYLDVDIEAIVRLQPDVVLLLKEQSDLADQLEEFGMEAVFVDHMSVEGILSSISIVGQRFDRVEEAESLVLSLEKRIAKVASQSATKTNRSVLLSIGREFGVGKVTGLVAAGAGGYHQQLLQYAGYANAYSGRENFPQLSREHLIRMNPDIIIDMVNSKDAERYGLETIRADWDAYAELDAVKHNKVFLMVGDGHFVPGPRFVDTLEWIAGCEERGGGE